MSLDSQAYVMRLGYISPSNSSHWLNESCKIISLYSKDLNKKYFNIGLDVKFRKGGMIKNRCFSTCCINNFNHSKPILNKDVNFKDNNLKHNNFNLYQKFEILFSLKVFVYF